MLNVYLQWLWNNPFNSVLEKEQLNIKPLWIKAGLWHIKLTDSQQKQLAQCLVQWVAQGVQALINQEAPLDNKQANQWMTWLLYTAVHDQLYGLHMPLLTKHLRTTLVQHWPQSHMIDGQPVVDELLIEKLQIIQVPAPLIKRIKEVANQGYKQSIVWQILHGDSALMEHETSCQSI